MAPSTQRGSVRAANVDWLNFDNRAHKCKQNWVRRYQTGWTAFARREAFPAGEFGLTRRLDGAMPRGAWRRAATRDSAAKGGRCLDDQFQPPPRSLAPTLRKAVDDLVARGEVAGDRLLGVTLFGPFMFDRDSPPYPSL